MNKFLRNNLDITLGSLVVVDGMHKSAELASSLSYREKIYQVILIGSDESGEYIEIEKHNQGSDESGEYESFFRHSLSLLTAPRPLDISKCDVGKMCLIGKMLDHLPYIEEFDECGYYSDLIKVNESNLDKTVARDIIFKILKVEDNLVQIYSLRHNILMILPPYMLYEFRPSSLYEPKLLTRD